ncbi:MAG TPA: aspartyl protease family protein [Kofleriaceae bacterium]
MRTPFLLALPTLLACGAAPPRPGGSDAAALVACWRDALGGGDRLAAIRSIEREARVEADGLTGKFHSWSRADGAYREEESLGPSSDMTVYADGRGWSRAGLGAPLEMTHQELARLKTATYLESFGPVAPGRMAGHVRAGARPYSLIVAADGGRDETIVLDPATCLPRQQEHQTGATHVTITWPRWTTVDGVRLPGEVAIKTSRGDEQRVVYTATRANVALDPALFRAPGIDPRARVPHLAAPLEMPAELTQNHVYVQARVNGQGPVALLVDTGAGSLVIDQTRAAQLGLRGAGSVSLHGAGDGKLSSQLAALPTVDLGGTQFTFEAAETAPLTALSHREGRAMEGIFGYELLGHYVTEFDYAAPAVRLHDAASFRPPPDATALPFYFWDTKPIVTLSIELADGRTFSVDTLIDTGDRGAFSLSSTFVRLHHLADGPGPVLRAPLGFGVGGQTKQALGRVAAVHLGPLVFRDVLTSFHEDTGGATADDDLQAQLGSALMKQLTVWVDYPRRQMWVRKNAHFGEPFDYDASGALLESPDDSFRRAVVKSVLPGSPAADAGLAPDDEIVTVDGLPVAGLTLEAIRTRLKRAGQRVRLEVRHGDTTRTVELALRALI